jgi:hypothetical protein
MKWVFVRKALWHHKQPQHQGTFHTLFISILGQSLLGVSWIPLDSCSITHSMSPVNLIHCFCWIILAYTSVFYMLLDSVRYLENTVLCIVTCCHICCIHPLLQPLLVHIPSRTLNPSNVHSRKGAAFPERGSYTSARSRRPHPNSACGSPSAEKIVVGICFPLKDTRGA